PQNRRDPGGPTSSAPRASIAEFRDRGFSDQRAGDYARFFDEGTGVAERSKRRSRVPSAFAFRRVAPDLRTKPGTSQSRSRRSACQVRDSRFGIQPVFGFRRGASELGFSGTSEAGGVPTARDEAAGISDPRRDTGDEAGGGESERPCNGRRSFARNEELFPG